MASVFDVGALEYKDEAGNTREAQGVFISSTPEYTDAAGNVRSATPVYLLGGGPPPEPFWNPFTVTTAQLDVAVGYEAGVGGSITNEPIDGFTVIRAVNDGAFKLEIEGPSPLATDALLSALVGIDAVDYNVSFVQSVSENGAGAWFTLIQIFGITGWTIGQQIPIVVIPQP